MTVNQGLLCHIDEIAEGQSKGFQFQGQELFAVKKAGQIYLYVNHCPHIGVNLEWLPDQFLDSEGCLIQCSMHGALFTIETGQCIAGPCQGEALTPLSFKIIDQHIYLQGSALGAVN